MNNPLANNKYSSPYDKICNPEHRKPLQQKTIQSNTIRSIRTQFVSLSNKVRLTMQFKIASPRMRTFTECMLISNCKITICQKYFIRQNRPFFPNIIALRAAVRYISKINIVRIEERIRYLIQYLIDRLAELKIQILSPLSNLHRSAIIVFKSRSPEHLVAYLGKRRIIVSARGGGIRVSPHFYNDEGDIDRLILALKTCHA